MNPAKLLLLTALSLCAFAGNSVLCRIALKSGAIDAATFTLVRIAAGAAMLTVLAFARRGVPANLHAGSWAGAFALSAYAVAFSFAYVRLDAATGALLLFGAVQLSLIGYALVRGERASAFGTLGIALGIGGLVALLAPGASAPPLTAALLMVAAGAAWAWYTVLGRRSGDALNVTAGSFLRALPIAALAALPLSGTMHADAFGLAYAMASGAITSGIGYTLWYLALPHLSTLTASTVQLCVPILAALAGVALLGETLTLRLVAASIAVLGGIAIVAASNARRG